MDVDQAVGFIQRFQNDPELTCYCRNYVVLRTADPTAVKIDLSHDQAGHLQIRGMNIQ